MTLINDSEQHVGRTAKVHERLCGSRHSLRSALRSPMRTKLTLPLIRPMTAFDNLHTQRKTPWAENQAVRADAAGLESV